jgi:integrase
MDLHRAAAITAIDLSESAKDRLRRATRPATRTAYWGDLRRFLEWCVDRAIIPESSIPPRNLPPRKIPDTDLQAAFLAVVDRANEVLPVLALKYVNHLADAGKAPPTLDRALAAVAVAYRAATGTRLNTDGARKVITTHKRDHAENGGKTRKTSPATVAAIRKMVAALDCTTPIGIRDRALLVLGFAMGARRSELAALNIADITEAEAGIEVLVRTSKTDKDSAGREVAILYGSDPNTCPVRTVRAWLAALAEHGRTTGPLFVRIDVHGNLGRVPTGRGSADGRLTGQAVAIVVQRAATAAGVGPGAVWAGHSLRRGFATEARRAGHDQVRIGRQGGWVDGSRALAGYFEQVDRWTDNPLQGIGL